MPKDVSKLDMIIEKIIKIELKLDKLWNEIYLDKKNYKKEYEK